MWSYDKKLQYPVNIKNPNPKLAKYIISQYGGANGNCLSDGKKRRLFIHKNQILREDHNFMVFFYARKQKRGDCNMEFYYHRSLLQS